MALKGSAPSIGSDIIMKIHNRIDQLENRLNGVLSGVDDLRRSQAQMTQPTAATVTISEPDFKGDEGSLKEINYKLAGLRADLEKLKEEASSHFKNMQDQLNNKVDLD